MYFPKAGKVLQFHVESTKTGGNDNMDLEISWVKYQFHGLFIITNPNDIVWCWKSMGRPRRGSTNPDRPPDGHDLGLKIRPQVCSFSATHSNKNPSFHQYVMLKSLLTLTWLKQRILFIPMSSLSYPANSPAVHRSGPVCEWVSFTRC